MRVVETGKKVHNTEHARVVKRSVMHFEEPLRVVHQNERHADRRNQQRHIRLNGRLALFGTQIAVEIIDPVKINNERAGARPVELAHKDPPSVLVIDKPGTKENKRTSDREQNSPRKIKNIIAIVQTNAVRRIPHLEYACLILRKRRAEYCFQIREGKKKKKKKREAGESEGGPRRNEKRRRGKGGVAPGEQIDHNVGMNVEGKGLQIVGANGVLTCAENV